MAWNWLSFKKNPVANMITRVLSPGRPVWTDQKFTALAKEGYMQNVWAKRCIELIAQSVAGVPWVLYEVKANGEKVEIEDPNHPYLKLLSRPNPTQGKAAFFESLTAFLMLAGNSYISGVGPSTGPNAGKFRELWILRPDRTSVIPSTDNLVGGYQYEVNGMTQDFKPEQVRHLKFFHPLDDFYGLSPIQNAARTIDLDNEADSWNVALLQNNAQPSGGLSVKGNLLPESRTELKMQLEERYTGKKNAGRPMILEGDMDWKQFGLNPVDMAWPELKSLTRLQISTAFGVPPELLGDHEHATYSNYKEARAGFYEERILPLLDYIKDELFNAWLTPAFGENLLLDYDRDEIEALQEDREKTWNRVNKAFISGWLRVNEARSATGYEDDPEFGELYSWQIKSQSKPQDDESKKKEKVPKDGEEEDDEKSSKKKYLQVKSDEEDDLNTAELWLIIENLRKFWDDLLKEDIEKLFNEEELVVKELLETVKTWDDFAFAMEKREPIWDEFFKRYSHKIMNSFGQRQLDELGYIGEYDPWAIGAQDWIEQHTADKVTHVTTTTKNALKPIVQQIIDKELSIPQGADLISEVYIGFKGRRATVIARTEVMSASNAGAHYAAIQTGAELWKTWISTHDSRVRDAHDNRNGKIEDVLMFEPFIVGGEELMFPGDNSKGASAENIIQCRCTQGYYRKKKKEDE
jgi:HK97 family phage portal protein